ncbi:hypothetical protein MMC10_005110 [Thelotrema lepadinum]|nr:hypothetical protein [Thelotrema lepadinum]
MVSWNNIFSSHGAGDRIHFRDDMRHLLSVSNGEAVESAYPPNEVTKVALRLKHQIEQVIPIELDEWKITKANSPIITRKVIQTAKQAGGKEFPSCIIYCLLVCKKWFERQALLELWDSDLHRARAVACEVLAKKIIESEEDEEFLMQETLLKRYSILINGRETQPANAVERAVDLHALLVIGSSGYQKCISYLWRGWLIQDENDPGKFIDYKEKNRVDYWIHLDPDRLRTPQYQNAVQISMSFIYLVLYTIAINTINNTGDLDVIEGILYVFTAGFIFDEIAKLWKVGRYYIGFWNVFNSTLYSLLIVSFVTRLIALGYDLNDPQREHFNILSYNFLAFSAPMFWCRLLLYLDNLRFFGAMLVILKVMMQESLIFFLLLVVISVGFLQAFIGMDQVQGAGSVTRDIVQAMANSLMQSPDFSGFDEFAPPFGIILYYFYTGVVMVILLNILIALFNSAYESVTDNAIDEYLGLFAAKTMQFVRAPDENVFIPPFNLIELFFLVIPLEWWMSKDRYQSVNRTVMGVIYSPMLLVTAWLETRTARKVNRNRDRNEADDNTIEEWEQLSEERGVDFEADGWAKKVMESKPNVETDAAVLEIRELKRELEVLARTVDSLKEGMREK